MLIRNALVERLTGALRKIAFEVARDLGLRHVFDHRVDWKRMRAVEQRRDF